MPIANIIRERRRELGLTQEQVARSLGVSAPAVNKWERGASYPDITIIPPLARLLQTDANTLLSFEADLDEETNLAIQREVDRLVREEGYAEGFAYAQEQLRLYPASDELAIVLTQYLDGALTLFRLRTRSVSFCAGQSLRAAEPKRSARSSRASVRHADRACHARWALRRRAAPA